MAGTSVVIPENTIRFGDCELNASALELRRGRRVVKLERIPLQVLLVLIQERGKVVTREAIADRIWGKDVFVDVDNGINTAIRKIRQVLSDDPQKPRFVETIAGRGYRFIAPVVPNETQSVPAEPVTAQAPATTAPAADTNPRSEMPRERVDSPRRVWSRTGLAVLALLGVLGIAGWLGWKRFNGERRPIRSIAVIPLQNLSGDPSQDYFADGMTEELITELARIQSLRVTSHTSVMDYKGTKKHLPQIAQELGVDAILEGSVIRENESVRVTVQLLDGPADRHLWGEEYERPLNGVLNLQRDVGKAIAQEVRAKLTAAQQGPAHREHAVVPAAYDEYLQGRFYFDNGFMQREALKKGKQHFERSIQIDPNFAPAYAGLANTYLYLAFAGVLSRDLAYRSANQAIDKAMELDDSVGEAHETLGTMKEAFNWDWEGAEREYNRAIALAPSYSCAHESRAGLLALLGRRDEALAEVAKVDQLDVGITSASVAAGAYYALRDYPNLIDGSRRVLLIDSKNSWGHRLLGVGLEGTGKLQEAIAEYQKAVDLSDGDPYSVVLLAHAWSAAGKKAEAQKILRDLERKFGATASASPYRMALIYAGLGETDKAFASLNEAVRKRSFELSDGDFRADPAIDNLRSDPRFLVLVSQVGLPTR